MCENAHVLHSKNTKLSPTTAQHLVGVKTVKKTILGGRDDGQSHALSNWQFPIALSKSGLKKLIRLRKKWRFAFKARWIRGQFGCSYKDSEISFQVPCLRHPEPKTFFSYTTTTTRGQDIHPQTTNRSTLSISNQLLVFYFATVSFFFFVCVFFVLKI